MQCFSWRFTLNQQVLWKSEAGPGIVSLYSTKPSCPKTYGSCSVLLCLCVQAAISLLMVLITLHGTDSKPVPPIHNYNSPPTQIFTTSLTVILSSPDKHTDISLIYTFHLTLRRIKISL